MSAGRISNLALLEPEFRARVQVVQDQCDGSNLKLKVRESIRSPGRQSSLYSRGRGSDPNAPDFGRIVTKSRAWQSAHQYGLAVDFVFFVNGEWTWEAPMPGDWEVFQGIARAEGLVTIESEMPHVQATGFDWRKLERGPDNEAGWLQWLRVRNG